MLIQFATPPGSTAWTPLADESPTAVAGLAERISGWQLKLAKSPQVKPTAASLGSGAAPYVQDVGNGHWTLAFTVDRQHASADAALAFLQTHAARLNLAGVNFDLQITVGAVVTMLSNTALTEITPDPHSDQSTKYKYAFKGGTYNISA